MVRVAKAIDGYIALRSGPNIGKIDPRLQDIIESIFDECIREGNVKQVFGATVLFIFTHNDSSGYRYCSRVPQT